VTALARRESGSLRRKPSLEFLALHRKKL
jgi:hypothetical protein